MGLVKLVKDISKYIRAMLIIFALTWMVSASSDIRSVSSDENETIDAIQVAIDGSGSNWTAGKTSVSNISVVAKRTLCGARVASLPPGATLLCQPEDVGVLSGIFDWRDKDGENWVTSVKSQGSCGSCWAFSAVGAVESAFLIYTNDPAMNIDLSEQHLVSDCCSAGSCDGGVPGSALEYIRDTGVPDEYCFPYIASNSDCAPCSNWTDQVWMIEDLVYVNSSTDDFKYALQNYGPISVILSVPDDWYYYQSGVYEPIWVGDVGWANHAVLLVGWNNSDGCWIIKNSWGTGWGEDGYARVKYGDLEKYDYAYAVTDVITGNEPPVAFASATPTNGEAPLTMAFVGFGNDSDGVVVSYHWEFGDGESSGSQNSSHIYSAAGMYTATLTVSDDDGAIGTDNVTIVVNKWESPVAAIASSVYRKYVAETAIDDKTYTYWLSEQYDGPPCWIRFDLGEIKTISKVRAMIYRKDVPMILDVQVSTDAANWTTVAYNFTIDEAGIFVEIPFDQINAGYVRLYETSLNRIHGQCTEFDVYVVST